MEELMDFIVDLHKQDRRRAAEKKAWNEGYAKAFTKGYAQIRAKEIKEVIKRFLKNHPEAKKLNAAQIANSFGVDEKLVKPLLIK